ncbi:MAG: 1-acyl-sn-glycerol-3-phosphate acyltransferase [Polyangiaceae bacterium]|nr:1-acyl-sn-glycerol-3-phosphate acyltransferase [Polyangiaceae bacterium]
MDGANDGGGLGKVCFDTVRRSHSVLAPITRRYFRSETRGMARIPQEQCVLVTHHDGGVLPINGICFGVEWYDHFRFGRPLFVLSHDFIHALFEPFTDLLPRSGVVRADRATMDRVLESGHSVLVFPGAARESFRPYGDRRLIDLGGRTGFVRQALRHRVPVVPFVSAGAHETLFVLRRGARFARWLGFRKVVRSGDVLPICLGLPWGIWALPVLPQLPLPSKITTEVLEPIELTGDPDDEVAVARGFELVLSRMKSALVRLYAERRYPILG